MSSSRTQSLLPYAPRVWNAMRAAGTKATTLAATEDTFVRGLGSQTVAPRTHDFEFTPTRHLLGTLYRKLFVPLSQVDMCHFTTMRFNPWVGAALRESVSMNNCVSAVHQAKTAPAYAAFLASAGVPSPQRWSDVPVTSKDNYIKPAASLADRACFGVLPERGVTFDTTSGSTGAPVTWARGPAERKNVATLIQFATEVQFNNEPITVIDAFDMGAWATGMTVARVMPERAKVFTPGRDAEKVLGNLQTLGTGENYVLMGYPPFLEQLVRHAEHRGVDLHAYRITAVLGGEGISEASREALRQPNGPFLRVISSYGASDLDINIGIETDFEVSVRRAMATHADFAQSLYRDHIPSRFHGAVPMVFHYDPQNYFIESDARGHLLFTCTRGDRLEPRIRYDLGDVGTVIPVEEVVARADEHGVELPAARTNLPLLLVWGRDDAVSFEGAKVTPGHLLQAIQAVDTLADNVGRYAFYQRDAGALEIFVETIDAAMPAAETARALQAALRAVSPDFRQATASLAPEALPPVRFFAPGQSPMAKVPGVKNIYILRGEATW